MRIDGQRESRNVIDARGRGGRGGAGRPIALSGGVIVLVLVVSVVTGTNPLTILGQLQGDGGAVAVDDGAGQPPDPNDPSLRLVKVVLGSTEEAWGAQFAARGARYVEPKLTVFRGSVDSACGNATAAVGPFYCPADRMAYLDLTFFDELAQRFGAPGDFAAAYVIAHEVGHHLQTLDGTSQRVRAAGDGAGADGPQVRLELQADCYAGVWAAHAQKQGLLEPGDVDEALRAAAAIGDDTLQKRGRGKVMPESFTHGTSAQRARWFKEGMQGGTMAACDTFAARAP